MFNRGLIQKLILCAAAFILSGAMWRFLSAGGGSDSGADGDALELSHAAHRNRAQVAQLGQVHPPLGGRPGVIPPGGTTRLNSDSDRSAARNTSH